MRAARADGAGSEQTELLVVADRPGGDTHLLGNLADAV
jgi:hypothetical protein